MASTKCNHGPAARAHVTFCFCGSCDFLVSLHVFFFLMSLANTVRQVGWLPVMPVPQNFYSCASSAWMPCLYQVTARNMFDFSNPTAYRSRVIPIAECVSGWLNIIHQFLVSKAALHLRPWPQDWTDQFLGQTPQTRKISELDEQVKLQDCSPNKFSAVLARACAKSFLRDSWGFRVSLPRS